MKRIGLLLSSILLTILTTFQLIAQTAQQPVQYSLTLDPDGTYKVWMKSITGYTGNNAKIGTAQVSLVVPTATNFTVNNLTSANGMAWNYSPTQTRINNPIVLGIPTGKDYLVFNYTNATNNTFDIAANTDILLFSFKNSSACAGPISLWNVSDSYQVPNAENFNVGNQITIFGAGFGNRWNSNYGTSPVPCNAPPGSPDLQVSVTPPASITQNSPAIFAVNVSNVGTAPSTGITTVTTPIPTGMTYNGSSGAGWTCNQVTTNVVCTNPNPIANGSNSPYNLTFTPTQSGVGSISSTVSGGGDPTPSSSPTSNFTVNPATPSCLVEYKITTEADGSYKVWMKSNTTFTGTAATIGTAQVNILAPNATHLVVSNLTGFNGMIWTTSSQTRLDNPSQNPSFDYIVFNFSQASSPTVFDIVAGVEYPLFSFKNSATCVGPISLWASDDVIQVPNIQNFNVGNQISINGAGAGNKWCSNYGTTAPCPMVGSPNISVTTTAPSTGTVGTPITVNIGVNNTGTASTNSPITVITPIPACMTYAGTNSAGWVCGQQGSNVLCNYAANVAAGGSAPLALNFMPTQTCTTTFTTTTTGGGVPNPIITNSQPITINPISNPIVNVTTTAPSTGIVGTPITVNVNVSNTGNAPTNQPLTVTTPIPTCMTYTGFTGAGWTCNQIGTNVVCNNSTPIPAGSSAPLALNMTPNATCTTTITTTTQIGTQPNPIISSTNPITVNPPIVVGSPTLTIAVTAPATATQNVPYNYNVTVNNTGTAPTTGTTTVTIPFPAGFTYTGSTGTGWSCNQQGTNVVCNNPNPIAANGSSSLTVSVTPTVTGTINTFGYVSGGGTNTTAFSTLVSTTITSGTINQPNIVITSVTNPSTGNTGSPVGIVINISNTGTASSSGTLTFTSTLPAGVNFSSVNSGWNCQQTVQQLTCTTSNSIPNGSSIPLNIQLTASSPTTFTLSGILTGTGVTNGTVNGTPIIISNSGQNCTANDCGQGVRYGIKLEADGKTYTVYMKSAQTYIGGSARISTAQVTLKVPHGMGTSRFIPINITGNVSTGNMIWTNTLSNRVDAPSVDLANDYLFFGYTAVANPNVLFDIFANIEYPLFSFQNQNTCNGTVGLWETTDPLQAGFQNLNPGNQMTILGNGTSNAWKCNFSCALPCQLPADLTISATQPNPSLSVGQTSTIAITVTNLSANTSNLPITVSTTLPAGVSTPSTSFNVGAWTCTRTGQAVSCTNPNSTGLAQNGTLSLNLPVVPSASNAGQNLTFNFNVLSNSDSNLNNNSTTITTTVPVSAADLAISIPSFVLNTGQVSNVTVNVSNVGTSSVTTGLSVTMTLPNGATAPPSFTSNGWSCTTSGTNISCTHPNTGGFAPNASSSIIVPISIPANAVGGQTVTIIASVSAVNGESNLANNSTTGFGQVVAGPNLKLVKTASPTAVQGTHFDFNFIAYNIGGGNSSGMITVIDTLRNGLKYVSFSGSAWACSKTGVDTQNNDIVVCTSSTTLLANAGNSSSFSIKVNPTQATNVSNMAFVSGGGSSAVSPSAPCSNCANGPTSVFVQAGSDLTITIQQPNPVLIVGQPSNINIIINNTGGAVASGSLTVNIVMPVGLTMPPTFTTGTWTCTTSGQNVTCTNQNTGGIPAGGSINFNLTVTPPITMVGTTPTITVNVLPIMGESNTSNNGGALVIITPIAPPVIPDLAISFGQISNLTIGQQTLLPITVTNIGNGTATGQLTVTMPIPSGFTFTSGFSNGWFMNVSGNVLTATHPNTFGLNTGNSLSFPVGVTPSNAIINTFPNFIAVVNMAPNETNGLNNTAMFTTNLAVISSGVPNLAISTFLNNPFVVNQASIFNILVTNTGSVVASGQLMVTVTLPNGMTAPATFTTNGWTGTTSGQTITLIHPNISGLNSGGVLNLQIAVTPSNSLGNVIPNVLVFNVNQVINEVVFIDNTTYHISNAPVLVNAGPNIFVNVGTLFPSLTVGQTSNITINFANNGTQTQSGQQILNIIIPNGINVPSSFTTNGWNCTLVGQNLTCINTNTGGLQPNSNINLVIPITPGSGMGGVTPSPINIFVNGSTSPIIYNFTSQILLAPAPHLAVNVNMMPIQMIAGQTYNIPVIIQNMGSVNANGQITVNITLPNGMTVPSSFTQSGWTFTLNGQILTGTYQNLNGLPPGGSLIFLLPITPTNILVGTTPSITINVLPVLGQTNTSNTTIIYVINPPIISLGSPDLLVTVSQPSPALVANQNSTINISVQNVGSAVANGQLTVSFTLPVNFSTPTTTFTSGAWTCNVVGQTVTCTNQNLGGLAVNANSMIAILIRPSNAAVGSNFNISVNAIGVVGETNLTNNIFLLIGNVAVAPDPSTAPNLNLVLTYNQSATYYQNTPFNLNYLIYNSNSVTASSGMITVRDTLRYGLKFVSGTGIGWTINKVGVDSQGNDIIVATYNNAISSNISTGFSLTVNPTLTGTIYNQAYIIGGGMTITMRGSSPCVNCIISPTGPIIINQATSFNLAVKAVLQGPYVSSTGMMHDSLRVKNLIPLNNPYTTMGGFTQIGSGTETTTSSVLSVSGSNAIVDWVLIELRNASNPSQLIATKAGLIQRDGDVVSPMDGVSLLQFTSLNAGSYYVSIRHRNHLGAMSATPITTTNGSTATLDLTNPSQPAYKLTGGASSNFPQNITGGKAMLWAGNAIANNQVIFQGPSNDVDLIFFTIISNPLNTQVMSNFIHTGYDNSDVNMDGRTVFQGPNNEVDIIFFNVLTHPENPSFLANFIIWQQIP